MKKGVRFQMVMSQGEKDALEYLAFVGERTMGDVVRRLIRAEIMVRGSDAVIAGLEKRLGVE
jgi:hypothetical protein